MSIAIKQRDLGFTTEDTLYFLLNIIGHDPIHDYGPAGGTEQRWSKNQIIVKQFTSDYYTFVNPLRGGVKRTIDGSSTTTYTTQPYTYLSTSPIKPPSPYPGIPRTLGQQPVLDYARGIYSPDDRLEVDYFNYINTIKDMKNIVNSTIIYTFLNHFLSLCKNGVPKLINYFETELYIVPYGLEQNYTDLIRDISNKFIGFCYINSFNQSTVLPPLNYQSYLELLCFFLSKDIVTQAIFENIFVSYERFEIDERNPEKKRRVLTGGKRDRELNFDESTKLLNDIKELNNREDIIRYLDTLNQIYNEYNISEGILTLEQRNTYEDTRKLLIEEYQAIFMNFNQTKKAGSLYGNLDVIPLIKLRYTRHTIDLIPNFYEKIEASILDYYKIIDEYNKTQEKIARQQLEDQLKAQQGDLTSMDKEVRKQFCKFIAKSTLYMTNICNNNGSINTGLIFDLNLSTLDVRSTLRKEINILLYIADWTTNIGWTEVTTQSLDDELIDYFKYYTEPIDNKRYVLQKPGGEYVVNNAAPLNTQLKNASFCPYTSILDGMSQCSWTSAQGNIEYGNMDFRIVNNFIPANPSSVTDPDVNRVLYYNGKLKIAEPPIVINGYPVNIQLSFDIKVNEQLILSGEKRTDVNNGIDLEAHFVLKNTLVNVIDYILGLDDTDRASIFTGGNIFDNLFVNFVNNGGQTSPLFNLIYSELLFKGTGDLFQEINCACKYGGYTMANYKSDRDILSFRGTDGEQVRFFAANDRPSGTRFIFMLQRGNPEHVNRKAMGGYYSKEFELIVKYKSRALSDSEVITINGFATTLGQLKNMLIQKDDDLKRTLRNKYDKNNKYKIALIDIAQSGSLQDVLNALRKNGVIFKNNKLMGGKTRRSKKTKQNRNTLRKYKSKKIKLIPESK